MQVRSPQRDEQPTAWTQVSGDEAQQRNRERLAVEMGVTVGAVNQTANHLRRMDELHRDGAEHFLRNQRSSVLKPLVVTQE